MRYLLGGSTIASALVVLSAFVIAVLVGVRSRRGERLPASAGRTWAAWTSPKRRGCGSGRVRRGLYSTRDEMGRLMQRNMGNGARWVTSTAMVTSTCSSPARRADRHGSSTTSRLGRCPMVRRRHPGRRARHRGNVKSPSSSTSGAAGRTWSWQRMSTPNSAGNRHGSFATTAMGRSRTSRRAPASMPATSSVARPSPTTTAAAGSRCT